MLHIQNLNKTYPTPSGEIVALDNLSLVILRGDFVAIVGRSGSGKTTLLNMTAGLDRPDTDFRKLLRREMATVTLRTLVFLLIWSMTASAVFAMVLGG